MNKTISGHLREKKGYFYAVINYVDYSGERKQKWLSTKLPVRGNKKNAEAILREFERTFEIPASDTDKIKSYVEREIKVDKNGKVEINEKHSALPTNMVKNVSLDDIPTDEVAFMLFSDYIKKYVPLTRKRKKKIEYTTYSSYEGMVESPIAPYYEEKGITLGELTTEDIQEFYDEQLDRVSANTVIHYHAIIRLALCHARKQGYIKENPIEEVDKPEKNQFVGKFYSSDELKELIAAVKGTKMELPVIFGGFYGLRRSEIVGLRWSAIDFDNNVFYVNHTVTTPKVNGKVEIVTKDRAKTKSSLRALPWTKA